MSDQNLEQYQLDLSGVSPDNLVVDESHTLIRQRNRAISLHHGAFFTESLVIKHVNTDYILRQHIDYKILQPYSTLIAATGKSVAGIILIHNSNVHQNLAISYQCVGGEFAITSKSLEGYLNSISDQGTTFSWYNSLIEDKSFEGNVPKLDQFDFHWLCFTLEKIRNAIIWSDSEYYDKIRSYLDSVMDSIEIQTKLALDSYLNVQFENFKTNVSKMSIGLSNIQNLGTTSTNEVIEASQPDSRITHFEFNKYITLQSLAVFKEEIYSRFALSSTTNIGFNRGVSITPSMETVIGMVNGAIGILKSKQDNTENGVLYDASVYPPSSGIDEEYTVLKISNNVNNSGGIYLYSERSGKAIYLTYHSNGNPDIGFTWNKLITNEDTALISQDIADHLLDFNNPHEKTKEDVGFFKLKNLPVVSREKILNLQACEEYLTMDGLLLFTKTHMVDKEAAAVDPRNDDRDAVQIIYTAQAEDKCLPPDCPCPETAPPPPPPPPVVVDSPLLIKINQFINSVVNDNVIIQPSTIYSDYFNNVNNDFPAHSVVGTYGYSDGAGGYEQTFSQVIKLDSICAGYHPGDIYAYIPNDFGGKSTTGINGIYVNNGKEFRPSIEILPDELYGNKEFVSVVKMPGRIPHYIRGVFSDTGIGELPRENFGFETFHTSSASALSNIPAIFTASPLNSYEDRRTLETETAFQNTLSVGTVRSTGNPDSYNIVRPVIYLTLDSHVANSQNILNGEAVVYNMPMSYNFGTGAYQTSYLIEHFFEQYDSLTSLGFSIDGTNESIPALTQVSVNVTNTYGDGAIVIPIQLDISSLAVGYNLIKLVLNTGATTGSLTCESHVLRIYKPPVKTTLTKTVPVFVDGVETGTINISRNSDDQKLLMEPFNSSNDYLDNPLSVVYFFEKDTVGDADPFVYLADVYYDSTEMEKEKNVTSQAFIEENFVEFTAGHTFEFMSQTEYNQLIRNLESEKRKYLEADKMHFTKYANLKSITVDEFNSITKVRIVKYTDPNYACIVTPTLIREPDEFIPIDIGGIG